MIWIFLERAEDLPVLYIVYPMKRRNVRYRSRTPTLLGCAPNWALGEALANAEVLTLVG